MNDDSTAEVACFPHPQGFHTEAQPQFRNDRREPYAQACCMQTRQPLVLDEQLLVCDCLPLLDPEVVCLSLLVLQVC